MTDEFTNLLETYGVVVFILGAIGLFGYGVLRRMLGDCFKL